MQINVFISARCNSEHAVTRSLALQRALQLHSAMVALDDAAPMEGPRVEVPTAEPTVDPSAKAEFTSPYHLFCKANRPMLPTNLKNADREKLLGEMWKSLSKEGRGAYRTGLALPARNGHGGTRAWVPTQGEEPPPPQIAGSFPGGHVVPRPQGASRKPRSPGGSAGSRRPGDHGWFETPTKWMGGEWFSQAERWARAKQIEDEAPEVLVAPPAKRRAAAEGKQPTLTLALTTDANRSPNPTCQAEGGRGRCGGRRPTLTLALTTVH